MVCAQPQRPQSMSHRAMPATREAQRYPHEEAFELRVSHEQNRGEAQPQDSSTGHDALGDYRPR